jgi:hypothetical protein
MTICNRSSLLVALGLLLASPCALAQAEDQAAARSLFDEGRKLLKAGKLDEACPKLEAAAKLYSSPGILLNLGDCYEKSGRTASAWTEFGESAAAAERAERRDQAAEARRRQAALEPKLSRLAVQVPREVPGLVVSRDGTDLAPAAWGSPIPIDAGAHKIRARAEGHESWETSVTVSTPGRTVSVEVPELAASPVAPVPVPSASAREPRPPEPAAGGGPAPLGEGLPSSARSRTLGFALVGGGAAVGIGGAALMIIEASRAADSRNTNTVPTTSASRSEYDSAKTPWVVGLAGAIAGGVAAATGVFLVATAHGGPEKTGATRTTPWITAGGGGLRFEGTW